MPEQNQLQDLLRCLRTGGDIHLIRETFDMSASVASTRAWVVDTAAEPAFRDELVGGVPEPLVPIATLLWQRWRAGADGSRRTAIKRLRRVVRAVAQMNSILQTCLEDDHRA